MRNLCKTIIVLFFVISFSPFVANSQCKGFAKNVCKLELLPYIHDGIYNATILSEGETAELFKTFYSGQDYRIAVCSDDKLPKIEFEVLDSDRSLLYSNKENAYSQTWDFTLESSQQLILSIQVPPSDEISDKLASGCISVLVGFMNKEDSFDQD